MSRGRMILVGSALLLGFLGLTALDGLIYRLFDPSLATRERLDAAVWYQLLRGLGSFWTWLVVGLGVLCLDRIGKPGPASTTSMLRGPRIALSAGAAGLLAEFLKLIVARERPATIQHVAGDVEALVYQGYHFRGLFAGFADGSNLGLPSSHAATAAGGAFALAFLWPRLLWPALAIALGCGLTRLLTGAHFATDVYVGIVLGWLVALGLGWAMTRARRGEEPA